MEPFSARLVLSAHAEARMHSVDGVHRVLLCDRRDGELYAVAPEVWDLLARCDGTQDLAAMLEGAPRELHDDARATFTALAEAGLLHEGRPLGAIEPRAQQRARPLDVLEWEYRCDGRGGCCRMFPSIVFTADEQARAAHACPSVLERHGGAARVFLPIAGARTNGLGAVALEDNHCVFLNDHGHCGVHVARGAGAKPAGCSIFPAVFVDDGERVRVSAALDCACVFQRQANGYRLVDNGASLPPSAYTSELPQHVDWGGVVTARDVARAWQARALEVEPAEDLVAWLLSAARALDIEGASPMDVWTRTFDVNAVAVLRDPISALAERAALRAVQDSTWRSPLDLSRVCVLWMAAALAPCVEDPSRLLVPAPSLRDDERFAWRAWAHGYAFVSKRPVADTLRELAMRLTVARVMAHVAPPFGDPGSAREHPLSAVEAVLLAHGLAR